MRTRGLSFGSVLSISTSSSFVGHLARETSSPLPWSDEARRPLNSCSHRSRQAFNGVENAAFANARIANLIGAGLEHLVLAPDRPCVTSLALPNAWGLASRERTERGYSLSPRGQGSG